MHKKGFTLIELLGVFTLLALILLVSVPTIMGMLKKQREKSYLGFLDDLYLATEAYVQNNDTYNLDEVGQTIYVKIEDVVKAHYFRSTMVNPKTNEKVNMNHYIKITVNEDHTYQYEYVTEKPA